MRLWVAFRAFFAALFSGEKARQIDSALAGPAKLPEPERKPEPAAPREPPKPVVKPRSDALTLLAALQREARLVDIVKEPLNNYTDAQIGAAARDVLRDCGTVLERMFGLQPLLPNAEGDAIELPAGFDAARYRLSGNVSGEPPFRGRLVHPGWQATRCDIPAWSGSPENAPIVAAAEVEVR